MLKMDARPRPEDSHCASSKLRCSVRTLAMIDGTAGASCPAEIRIVFIPVASRHPVHSQDNPAHIQDVLDLIWVNFSGKKARVSLWREPRHPTDWLCSVRLLDDRTLPMEESRSRVRVFFYQRKADLRLLKMSRIFR